MMSQRALLVLAIKITMFLSFSAYFIFIHCMHYCMHLQATKANSLESWMKNALVKNCEEIKPGTFLQQSGVGGGGTLSRTKRFFQERTPDR